MYQRNVVRNKLNAKQIVRLLRQDVKDRVNANGLFISVKAKRWLLAVGLARYSALAKDLELRDFAMVKERSNMCGLSNLQQAMYDFRDDVLRLFPLDSIGPEVLGFVGRVRTRY